MSTQNPAYVYAYEVVSSDHPKVPVGSHLANKGRELEPVWEFYDMDTGKLMTVVGKRQERLCSACYARKPGTVNVHGHGGEHGVRHERS